MKKVTYGFLFLFITLCLQSCLHDEKNFFDDSASQRMEKAVTIDQQTLESSPNGWILNYYPGENYSNGGYAYLIKFKNGKATVASDFAGSDSTFTSDYAMVKDQGPILTFDTYNPIMHHFGEATADNITSDEGDYEFVVDKVTKDSVIMTGKRWGNKMVMTRLPENTKWSDYLDSISNIVEDMSLYCTFKCMNGNDSVADVILDPDARIAKVTTNEGPSSISFTPTTKGISLCKPLNVGNTSVQNFVWNGTNKFTSTSNVSLVHYYPRGYHKLSEYAGTYNLYYNDYGTEEYDAFTLTVNADKTGLTAHSDDFDFDFTFSYSKAWGNLSVITQDLGPCGTSYDNIKLCPESNVDGYYTWGEGIGVNLEEVSKVVWDNQDVSGELNFVFVDNGKWDHLVDSFYFVRYLNGERDGIAGEIPYVEYFVKTN